MSVSRHSPRYSMVIDLDLCVGCGACVVACKSENGAPGQLVYDPVSSFEATINGVAKTIFLPLLCMHCDDAPCIKACPSRAISKRSDGIVIIDEDNCCGFRACVTACPYGAIQVPTAEGIYGSSRLTSLDHRATLSHLPSVAQKCTLCSHRIDAGQLMPACVEVCPTECRIFIDTNNTESMTSQSPEKKRLVKLRVNANSKPSVSYLLSIEDGLRSGRDTR